MHLHNNQAPDNNLGGTSNIELITLPKLFKLDSEISESYTEPDTIVKESNDSDYDCIVKHTAYTDAVKQKIHKINLDSYGLSDAIKTGIILEENISETTCLFRAISMCRKVNIEERINGYIELKTMYDSNKRQSLCKNTKLIQVYHKIHELYELKCDLADKEHKNFEVVTNLLKNVSGADDLKARYMQKMREGWRLRKQKTELVAIHKESITIPSYTKYKQQVQACNAQSIIDTHQLKVDKECNTLKSLLLDKVEINSKKSIQDSMAIDANMDDWTYLIESNFERKYRKISQLYLLLKQIW